MSLWCEIRRPADTEIDTTERALIRGEWECWRNRIRVAPARIPGARHWVWSFFRLLAFGLLVSPGLVFAAETNQSLDLPASSLRPPRGEILPSFWELYGTWVILGGVLGVTAIGLTAWLLVRPKPPAPVPPAVPARKELEEMRHQSENGALLSRTSQILRRYIAAAFVLPRDELTTSEFCQTLLEHPEMGPELSNEVRDFLQACDLRKFARVPPTSSLPAVARALEIINHSEQKLVELSQSAAATNIGREAQRPRSTGEPQGVANGG